MVLTVVFEVMYQLELPSMVILHMFFMMLSMLIFLMRFTMVPQAMHLTMELSALPHRVMRIVMPVVFVVLMVLVMMVGMSFPFKNCSKPFIPRSLLFRIF
jgi:hypothetical protein